jgi:hypothetical protein
MHGSSQPSLAGSKYFPHKCGIRFDGSRLDRLFALCWWPRHYWPFSFPAFTIGTVGVMTVYANATIAIFPPLSRVLRERRRVAAVSSMTMSMNAKSLVDLPPVVQFAQDITKKT